MHFKVETTQFVDIYIFIQTMNYQFPRPSMLQMKFEPNRDGGFNLTLNELLFERVDRQQTMIDNCLPYKLP